jgi:hypothetical protein
LKTANAAGHRVPAIAMVCALVWQLQGCASLLPKASTESPTFQTFEEAQRTIETLVPQKSKLADLVDRGLTPSKQPNTLILTHADVVRRMVNGSVLGKEDLDPGILTCINARDACRGWEFNVARISKARTGNFFADFVNFKRRTETTGWRFNALVLLVDDVVVYRGWGGQPAIQEVEINNNPLGPFQDMGPSSITNAR